MKTIALIFVVLTALVSTTVARRMDRCSLVRAMHDRGVSRGDLARWACIAEHESSYRTHVVGPANTDGSHDYGIFQINDRYWCRPSSGKYARGSANMCDIDCDDLLGDDIGPSMDCALQVKAASGWGAWTTWKYCNGHLPSVDDCFVNFNEYCGFGFGKN